MKHDFPKSPTPPGNGRHQHMEYVEIGLKRSGVPPKIIQLVEPQVYPIPPLKPFELWKWGPWNWAVW